MRRSVAREGSIIRGLDGRLARDLLVLAAFLAAGYFAFTQYNLADRVQIVAAQSDYPRFGMALGLVLVLVLGLLLYACTRAGTRLKQLTERVKIEEVAQNAAMHDQLTGLPNRRHLKGVLNWHLAQQGDTRRMAVIACNIDGFKAINEKHGRAAGDELLVSVGQLLNMRAGVDGFAARLGADDFAIVLLGYNEETLMDWLTALLTAIEQPFTLTAGKVEIGASLGVAIGPTDAGDAETLMHRADLAMRRCKEKTRGWFAFFKTSMGARVHERAVFEHELFVAVRDDLIDPWYQPVVQLETGKVVGYEVLARWPHEDRGLLMPDQFIPAIEGANLIGDMTLNLLRKACRETANWPGEPALSLNISAQMLVNPQLAQQILSVLVETGFQPKRLEIELTETALVADFDAARAIFAALKEQGVKVAIDNFGAGHTSLRQLRELPFDRMKIDRSLVAAMATDREAGLLVRSMTVLAQNLNLDVVAEGIETPDQAQALIALGCDLGQGHHFGKATAGADLFPPEPEPEPRRRSVKVPEKVAEPV
jgi:diguanylate cyclase (GGDEF)-like protein